MKIERSYHHQDDFQMVCPFCECRETHWDSVEVLPPAGASPGLRVDASGEDERTKVVATLVSGVSVTPRRHTIRLHGKCEVGHSWTCDLGQHKGTTLYRIAQTGGWDK